MNYRDKPKIIGIIPHGPAYHYAPNDKPDIYWERPDGSFVGFWTREWLDLLGQAVLEETDRYEWEVWQPDYRADKVYSKMLATGVSHRLYPAHEKLYKLGIRSQSGIFSEKIIRHLSEYQNDKIILMLYGTYSLRVPLYREILKIFGPSNKFPIFYRSGGNFKAPLSEIIGLHRPLTYLDLIAEHFQLRRLLRYVDVISEMAESALREVRKIYNGRIERFTSGCDFDFWIPVPTMEIKREIRNKLNIPQERVVFFASGNFGPRKQFDKLLKAFERIQERNDFFLIIAGHGDATNTALLRALITPLARQGKAILHPYVTGKNLRDLYWLADIYLSASAHEGSSVAVMKAMACGLPILCTPVGETAERMQNYGVGKLIPAKNYDEWADVFLEILDKKLPEPIDIGIAREAYDWSNVAKRLVAVFDDLYRSRYL